MPKYYLAFKPDTGALDTIKSAINEYLADATPLVTTPLDRLHVTTLFLGEVEKSQALSVLGASQSCREFVVSLAGIGSFGNKVLYLGVEGGTLLRQLHETQCAAARAAIGPVQSNGYVPHLTLCKLDGKAPEKTEAGLDYNNHFEDKRARLLALDIFHQCLINTVGLYTKSELIDEVRLLP